MCDCLWYVTILRFVWNNIFYNECWPIRILFLYTAALNCTKHTKSAHQQLFNKMQTIQISSLLLIMSIAFNFYKIKAHHRPRSHDIYNECSIQIFHEFWLPVELFLPLLCAFGIVVYIYCGIFNITTIECMSWCSIVVELSYCNVDLRIIFCWSREVCWFVRCEY